MQIIPDETTFFDLNQEPEKNKNKLTKPKIDSPKVVLLVLSDPVLSQIYTDVFSANGFQVVFAQDGIEALDKAGKEEIGIIFAEAELPRMTGIELLKNLKENHSTVKFPVFIISRLGRAEDQEFALRLGAQEYITHGTQSAGEIVKKILRLFGADKFFLAVNFDQLDGPRFLKEFGDHRRGICPNCEKSLALSVKISSEKNNHQAVFGLECANKNCKQQKQVKKEDGTIMEISR